MSTITSSSPAKSPATTTQTSPPTLATEQLRVKKASRFGLLVYLLQALHFLFGITAIIGMLVNHTNRHYVDGTWVESHFNWQIVTFWVLAPLYALAFYFWTISGYWWPIMLVFCIASYRILRGWWQLVAHRPIGRLW